MPGADPVREFLSGGFHILIRPSWGLTGWAHFCGKNSLNPFPGFLIFAPASVSGENSHTILRILSVSQILFGNSEWVRAALPARISSPCRTASSIQGCGSVTGVVSRSVSLFLPEAASLDGPPADILRFRTKNPLYGGARYARKQTFSGAATAFRSRRKAL